MRARARTEIQIAMMAVCIASLSGGLALRAESAEPNEAVRLTGKTSPELYRSDLYWIGTGQGDLSKGHAVCQRVAEVAARADLARQIRVLIREHLVDRTRERTGKEPEQDIELTREEIVQEYLHDVKIIDRRVHGEAKLCTATAVMPKEPIHLKSVPATSEIPPPAIR